MALWILSRETADRLAVINYSCAWFYKLNKMNT